VVRKNYQNTLQLVKTHDNGTEETILLNDLHISLEKEIIHLPLKCRSVFELSRKEYKTNKEIAALLGISEKTVENHLTKAIRRLRLSLNSIMSFVLILSWTILISY
jgi:RNA polymerase sigma-70 factor (ECF subfamily)